VSSPGTVRHSAARSLPRSSFASPVTPRARAWSNVGNGYLETSSLPGRTFTCPDDFNAQLTGWLPRANARTMWVLGCSPAQRIGADWAAMLALPPVLPVTGWRQSLRLPRGHYVRLDSCDYSVHPTAVGAGSR
jgi:hypothetical protein